MNHTTIENQQIPERYVMGRLAKDEAEAFEAHFMTCDQCLEALELATAFHRDMNVIPAQDMEKAIKIGLLAWFLKQRTTKWAGLSSVLVLILVFGFLFRSSPSGISAVSNTKNPPQMHLLESLRSVQEPSPINLDAQNRFRIGVYIDAPGTFHIGLLNARQKTIWEQEITLDEPQIWQQTFEITEDLETGGIYTLEVLEKVEDGSSPIHRNRFLLTP